MKIFGRVKRGLGQGKFFMSLKGYQTQFYKLLKYNPYKGTLNLELDKKNLLKLKNKKRKVRKYKIKGFYYKNKEYKPITMIKAKLKNLKIGIIFPYYRHHKKNIIEIIAKQNLRKKFFLKDNSKIEITI
ncbi:MAG: DUF120 domain-containing protein [Candidatus Anstonellaceae archaeon]